MSRKLLTVSLAVILILTIMSCGTGEGKYVGKYISEDGGKILELKPDGTYRYEVEVGWGLSPFVTAGRWSVMNVEGREYINFNPHLFLSLRKSKSKGYYFEEFGSAKILLKQK